MSTRDFLRFLYGESQVDADTEWALRESENAAKLEIRKTPLVKALKQLGIPTENVTVDEEGGRLVFQDSESWHSAVQALGTVEAMNTLADEGWVPEFAGDTAPDANGPSEFVLKFLCLHVADMSELDKGVSADALNKEVKSGSDTVVPKEQKERDAERRYGVKESADALLKEDETFLMGDQPATCPKCGRRVDSVPDESGKKFSAHCEPCDFFFNLEEEPDDEKDSEVGNPLDDQGQPILVDYTMSNADGSNEDPPTTITWEEFYSANLDGMMDHEAGSSPELSEIRQTILRGETYTGGGGAAPLFKVWRTKSAAPETPVSAPLPESSARRIVEIALTDPSSLPAQSTTGGFTVETIAPDGSVLFRHTLNELRADLEEDPDHPLVDSLQQIENLEPGQTLDVGDGFTVRRIE